MGKIKNSREEQEAERSPA